MNIRFMLVTEDVSKLMGWLKLVALLNIEDMSSTEDVSEKVMVESKFVANENMELILSTEDVSKLMGWLKFVAA